MMTETFDIGQEFERLKANLPGGAAVAALRKQGLEDFLIKGLPTAKTESWRYADLKRLEPKRLAPAISAETVSIRGVTDWPLAAVAGGTIENARNLEGASVKSTGEVLQAKGADGQALFLPAVPDHPFDQLNRAFARDGFVLDLSPGAAVPGIEIAIAPAGMSGNARHVRNLIRLGAGATANIFLRTESLDEEGWLSAVTKIQIGEGATLSLYADFTSSAGILLSSLLGVRVARGGTFSYGLMAAGVASLRHEVHARLEGEGANLSLAGGLMAAAGEVVDVLTEVTHASGHSKSRQNLKAIAGAKGRTAFQGRIVVEENAAKTDAKQVCHSLLLDREGEANIKPELLIFADDVACAHGASVGEVDAAALFYLTQRGIPETEARAMLVRAFLSEILDGIPHASIRAAFEAKADAWMTRNFGGEARHE